MILITCPEYTELGSEIQRDFYVCFREGVEEIEECTNGLEVNHDDRELIHRLFRAMHSLKGNCNMVFLEPVVHALHELEEIVQGIRAEQYDYKPIYGEFMLAVIDRVEIVINELGKEGQADKENLDFLETHTDKIRQADDAHREEVAKEALNFVLGFSGDVAETEVVEESVDDLLTLLKLLAKKMDRLSPLREDRTKKTLELCLQLNSDLGSLVDERQLKAAVFAHDLGLAFIANGLDDGEAHWGDKGIKEHTTMAYQMMGQFVDLEEARIIVAQHHEQFDGQGGPQGLSGDDIHAGAKMLAIADAFCQATSRSGDQGFKKTLLSAVKDINSNSHFKFDPKFVEAFNLVIRKLYIAKR